MFLKIRIDRWSTLTEQRILLYSTGGLLYHPTDNDFHSSMLMWSSTMYAHITWLWHATINHFEQEHIQSSTATNICETSTLPAATYSSDRHSVIYYNIHIHNNSPLHASSNETAAQNRQCKQLSETTRTVFNTSISKLRFKQLWLALISLE